MLQFVGNGLKQAVLEVQEYIRLQVIVVRAAFSRPFYLRDLIEQLDQIGIGSLTVVTLAGFFTGAVLALQSGITLDQFGARPFVGRLVSASMVKELGPVLTIISDFVGIVGGWIVARYQLQVATGLYWSSITQALYIQDVWMGILKPFVLGFVIVSIACHVGLRTTGGTQGVGNATTAAVVAGSVAVIAVDFFLTRLMISVLY